MEKIAFVKKYSVQFVTQDGRQSQPFYFFQHYDHPSADDLAGRARGVRSDAARQCAAQRRGSARADAGARGAEGRNGRVIGVEARGPDGTNFQVFAPITIDCSGREQVATARDGWRIKDPQLNKLAIWTYYRGAKRDPGIDEGNTTVAYVHGRGWFWYIPMRDDIVSVGIVAEKDYLFSDGKDPAAILAREIEQNAWIKDHLAPAEQFGEYWVTSEFSLSLAVLRGGWAGARRRRVRVSRSGFFQRRFSRVEERRNGGRRGRCGARPPAMSAAHVSPNMARRLCRGIENMRKLVYAFYDTDFSFARMLSATRSTAVA